MWFDVRSRKSAEHVQPKSPGISHPRSHVRPRSMKSKVHVVHDKYRKRARTDCHLLLICSMSVSLILLGSMAQYGVGDLLTIYGAVNLLPVNARLYSGAPDVIGEFASRARDVRLEIFSAPKPFVGSDKADNERAIRSWLRLSPKPKVTLLGYEVGYDEAAEKFGINIERRVDRNFLGVPLFNSIINRANLSQETVTVVINGDILLFNDFLQTVYKVAANFRDYLVIGARYDIDALPADIDETDPKYNDRIRDHVLKDGTLHTLGGMDVWAWNTDGPRLFDTVMPPFVFGRGKYDNWMTHETIAAGRRHVVDASETCLTVHVRHDYHLVAPITTGNSNGDKNSTLGSRKLLGFWSDGKKSKFELFINIFWSQAIGSYSNQKGTVLFAPWKLSRCLDPSGTCILRRKRPGVCNCEASSFVMDTQTDPVVKPGSRVIRCGMVSVEKPEEFEIPVRLAEGEQDAQAFGLPLTMTSLIERVIINNTIVVSALNYGYRGIMMNWVCNMRHVGVTNFVIAALDVDLYKFAFTHGLPVYFEDSIFDGTNASLIADASYGSDAFKKLTKMKSRVVLRLLKQGHNVLWSDCDIVMFKNPIQDLWAYNVDMAIQTNAPDNEAMNGRRRINSGFYLARSNPRVLEAFETIIKVAAKSRMSEQPCFYDVICGKEGGNAIGDDACTYKNGLTLKLLDRAVFPNGITSGIWDSPPGTIRERFPQLTILHNNWVAGADGKSSRFARHGFVMYDPESKLCSYPEDW